MEYVERNGYLSIEGQSSTDDTITFTTRDGEVCVQIDSPWMGSTETGFGCQISFDLDVEAAQKVAQFLTNWLAKQST